MRSDADINANLAAVELANTVQQWCEGHFRDDVPFAEVTKLFRAHIAGLGPSEYKRAWADLEMTIRRAFPDANLHEDPVIAPEQLHKFIAESIDGLRLVIAERDLTIAKLMKLDEVRHRYVQTLERDLAFARSTSTS